MDKNKIIFNKKIYKSKNDKKNQKAEKNKRKQRFAVQKDKMNIQDELEIEKDIMCKQHPNEQGILFHYFFCLDLKLEN